ncbi:cupin domain-containing protein [Fusarium napiforme]|uniref:Cupin domain-containing protein n=1 Tax=Fusarium napiforme TaxID=42672 RepID=A0A8H5N5G9_9HYPO|nr:cupin domain-containing protein [Fusarium napiforme]
MTRQVTKSLFSFFAFLSSYFSVAADNTLPIPKRFITKHNDDGNAIFDTQLNDELPETILSTHVFYLGYVTQGLPIDLEDNTDIGTYENYISNSPGLSVPGGSVLRIVDFPPGRSAMHRTLSIDYGVVIEGEMELVLDSGENRVMKRGDVAVQRGTKHQWVNTDEEKWARMVFVLQESKQLAVKGVKLEEDLGSLGDELRPSA